VLCFLNGAQVASRLGRTRGWLATVELPTHDAQIGDRKGWAAETVDAWGAHQPLGRRDEKLVLRFLSRTEVAKYLGMRGYHSLSGVELPAPDALIGDCKGWTPATIDAWQAARPGRGRWGARTGQTRAGLSAARA